MIGDSELKLLPRRSTARLAWKRLDRKGISIATYNLYNLFNNEFADLKLNKHAKAIHDYLREPDIIAVQEVENKYLLEALVNQKPIEGDYGVVLIEGPDSRGINVGLIYRKERIAIINAEVRQTCTNLEDGYGPGNDPHFNCPEGKNPLFSRPPLVVYLDILVKNGTKSSSKLWLIVNHFKSKVTYEPEHFSTEPRRFEQAVFVSNLVKEIQNKSLDAKIVVLGDLNDFEGSLAIAPLTTDEMLLDLIKEVANEERYTHVFNGVSQVLDHIMISPSLKNAISEIEVIHFNADFSRIIYGYDPRNGIRSSDHDIPLIVIQEIA